MSLFLQKNEQKIYLILLILLFPFLSLMFFSGAYHFIGDLLDFSHLVQFIPSYLAYLFLPLLIVFCLYFLSRPKNLKEFKRVCRVFGFFFLLIGLLLVFLVPYYISCGLYFAPLMQTVNALFPLDLVIYGMISFLLGVYLVIRATPFAISNQFLTFQKKKRTALGITFPFVLLYVIIALYLLGSLFTGIDFAAWNEKTFPLMIPSYLLMGYVSFLPFYQIVFLSKRKRKSKVLTILPIVFTLLLDSALLITNLIEPNLYVYCGKAYFPIDFEGSLNVAPLVLAIFPLIGSIGILIFSYPKKKE